MRLADQIEWLEGHIKHMRLSLPNAIDEKKISAIHAAKKLDCAQATLATLHALRTIHYGFSGGAEQ